MKMTPTIELAMRAVEVTNKGMVIARDHFDVLTQALLKIALPQELFTVLGELLIFAGFIGKEQQHPEIAKEFIVLIDSMLKRLEELVAADGVEKQRCERFRDNLRRERSALESPGTRAAFVSTTGVGLGLRPHKPKNR